MKSTEAFGEGDNIALKGTDTKNKEEHHKYGVDEVEDEACENDGDYEGDYEGEYEGDYEGEYEGDFEGDYEGGYEGDYEGGVDDCFVCVH